MFIYSCLMRYFSDLLQKIQVVAIRPRANLSAASDSFEAVNYFDQIGMVQFRFSFGCRLCFLIDCIFSLSLMKSRCFTGLFGVVVLRPNTGSLQNKVIFKPVE